jgi:hypothetical protein
MKKVDLLTCSLEEYNQQIIDCVESWESIHEYIEDELPEVFLSYFKVEDVKITKKERNNG